MIKFVKSTTENKIFLDYIKSINGILELTHREMEVLSELFKQDYGMSDSIHPKNIADKNVRKRIMKDYNISKENLSRFISKFKRKGILISEFDDLYVNPRLMPQMLDDQIIVDIIIKLKEKNEE